MAKSLNDILFRFLGDTKSLDKATKRGSDGLKGMDKNAGLASSALSGVKRAAGALAVAFGAREIATWTADAVQMAVAAEEVDSKFKAVFGTAKDFTEQLSAWADMAGITDTKSRDLAATFGNLAQATGLSDDATEALTLQVATLAGDLASFNDADPSAVFDTLNTAVLTAERDGLKKFGISVSELEVKTRAMELAVADGRDEITKADKATASYSLIAQAAGKANGDLERTSESLANKQRRLKAEMKELQEEIGRRLLPAYQSLFEAAVDLAPVLEGVAGKIADVAVNAGETVRPVIGLAEGLGDVTRAADDATGGTGLLSSALGFLTTDVFGLTNVLWRNGPGALKGSFIDMHEYLSAADEDFIRLQESLAGSSVRADQFATDIGEVAYWTERAGSVTSELPSALDPATVALDKAAAAADAAAKNLSWLNDMVDIFSGNIFGKAARLKEAAAELAAVEALFAGGGGSGQVADPVAASQKQNDFIQLGGNTGG